MVDLTPNVVGLELASRLAEYIDTLSISQQKEYEEREADLERRLQRFLYSTNSTINDKRERLAVATCAYVLTDLAKVGWTVTVNEGPGPDPDPRIIGERPPTDEARSARRWQLLAARSQVLREQPKRKFVDQMEADRLRNGQTSSVHDLMRDGRDLVKVIEESEGHEFPISPYVQLVEGGGYCEHTGIATSDIWRYFRLTWTNPPQSIPARQMRFLVRDRSAPNHPVMGIGELSSASVMVSARDTHLGWDINAFETWRHDESPKELLSWVKQVIQTSLEEVYADDFSFLSGVLEDDSSPKNIVRLKQIKAEEREKHEASAKPRSLKEPIDRTDSDWKEEALTPLFRSKRAGRLADLYELWKDFARFRGGCDVEDFLTKRSGVRAFTRLIRTAKARTQGTAIAELTICGAIPPYNELLAGKLVAVLAASPELQEAYQKRYRDRPSIIVSSMAGRTVIREAELVAISTTGLYGVRPSQYDRISVPLEILGDDTSKDRLSYTYLPQPTKGYGTFQFSTPTVRHMEKWLQSETEKRRISYQYGEGASPRMRLLREGLSSFGWSEKELLVHGLEKSLYVCTTAKNTRRFLLGFDQSPKRFIKSQNVKQLSQKISEWWQERWVNRRITRPDVISRISCQTLVHPITHGARVQMPEDDSKQFSLFGDDS